MHQDSPHIKLSQNFRFDSTHAEITERSINEKHRNLPTYKDLNLSEFCLKVEGKKAVVIENKKIAFKRKKSDANDNDGQLGAKNPFHNEIQRAIEEHYDLSEAPPSVIRLTPDLSDIFDNKEYLIADGRTRSSILQSEYSIDNGIYTVYELLETKNEKSLQKALDFLTFSKNAENNSNVCSTQDRKAIIGAVGKMIMSGTIELTEDKTKFKDVLEARKIVNATFGSNRYFRVTEKQKLAKIQGVLDSAVNQLQKIDSSIMSNQIVWASGTNKTTGKMNNLETWASGYDETEKLQNVCSTPLCFTPATYHDSERKHVKRRGVISKFVDLNTKNDFWQTISSYYRNWVKDSRHQTPQMITELEQLGRKPEDENPYDYDLKIALYIQSVSATEQAKSHIWTVYKDKFNAFMKFQFELQRNIIYDSLPSLRDQLDMIPIEDFSGLNTNRYFVIIGAVPTCTEIQDMTKFVPYVPNEAEGNFFDFDSTIRKGANVPPEKHVKPKRRTVKSHNEFEKGIISYNNFR